MPSVKCSKPEFKSQPHNKGHDTLSGIPIVWHQRVKTTMGHVFDGQTSDTCVPFAVVGRANHRLPCVTYSAEWCKATSVTSCPFHLPLLASIWLWSACHFWFAGKLLFQIFSWHKLSKFGSSRMSLQPISLYWCSNVRIVYFTTMYQLLTMPWNISFFGWGTKHKHHSQLRWVHSQGVLCTSE